MEKIDDVKESEIVQFASKIEGYSTTINLIEGRIKQMGTYISAREKIAKSDQELAEFLQVS